MAGYGDDSWRRARVATLQNTLSADVEACQAPSRADAATLRLEVTGDEVVDVTVSSESTELATCLEERVWALRLPAEFDRDTQLVVELTPRSRQRSR